MGDKRVFVIGGFCLFASTMQGMSFRSLLDAAYTNNVAAIKAYTGDVNQELVFKKDGTHYNALNAAIVCRHKEAAEALLEKGANPNQSCIGLLSFNSKHTRYTPLHVAVLLPDFDIVVMLLCAKAEPNEKDSWNCTPLYYAARSRLIRIACALLSAGADSTMLCGKKQQNAYQVAQEATQIAMSKCDWKARFTTFAAINHQRCGEHSLWYGMPQELIAHIASFLKPTVCKFKLLELVNSACK